jgi:hypothetical protein
MDNMSHFESRSGKLTCTAEEAFNFVTDIRNFEQFVPQGAINNWKAEKESCSFDVSMLGTVSLRLAEKEMYTRVVFAGDALMKNDFSLVLNVTDNYKNPAEVKVLLSAHLNPMMKMIAAKPIDQFLGKLIDEMESFQGWKKTRV